jgi:hypothetical protein
VGVGAAGSGTGGAAGMAAASGGGAAAAAGACSWLGIAVAWAREAAEEPAAVTTASACARACWPAAPEATAWAWATASAASRRRRVPSARAMARAAALRGQQGLAWYSLFDWVPHVVLYVPQSDKFKQEKQGQGM